MATVAELQAELEAMKVSQNDAGNTAWILTSTCLVLMMTIPGLALFYGGLAQKTNVLSTVMNSFTICCLITFWWMAFGYSIAFDTHEVELTNQIFGGKEKLWLKDINKHEPGDLPEPLFIMFQLTFAIITAAIITGSIAERMRFAPMLIFISIWHLLVYCPLCHWEWGGGFMGGWGVLDFAGGDVVHISSGVAGLAASLVVGKRKSWTKGNEVPPHNVMFVFIGASLLWVGWFGFNAGSAVAADKSAAMAMLVTHVAASMSGLSWMFVEWIVKGKPSVLGAVSGAISGLVVITPACGYVDHTAAFVMGIIAGPACYGGIQLKHMLGYDDALDAFGVHGVGGIVGGFLTGLFAKEEIGGTNGAFYGNPKQLGWQIAGILTTMVFSFGMTLIILLPLDFILKAMTGHGIRVSEDDEMMGLDLSEHGFTHVEGVTVDLFGKGDTVETRDIPITATTAPPAPITTSPAQPLAAQSMMPQQPNMYQPQFPYGFPQQGMYNPAPGFGY